MTERDYVEKDYYAALGVSKEASQEEISKAYRKLARKHHPDLHPDDDEAENRFKEISEAHAVLSDPEKRREYDRVRELVGSGGGFGGGFGGAGGFGGGGYGPFGAGGAESVNIEDLLGGLFGQQGARPGGGPAGGRGQRGQRGRDVETDLTLSFTDAMSGVTTTLRVSGRAPCSTCGGSGARPGTSPVRCPTCGGSGAVAQDQGLFSFSQPCPTCHGAGRQIPDPCATCQGSGAEQRSREIRARIPAGVKDGARIRLKGKGEAGTHGAPTGDLFVNVNVEAHPVFGRRGDHVTVRVPVTFPEAALGAKVEVPTLEGTPVTVKIPAGTESGKTLRVKGRGGPTAKGGRGDLLVTVDVAVPTKLTRTQRKLVEDLGDTMDPDEVRGHLFDTVPAG